MSRKNARDNAFKCIYQFEFDKEESVDKLLEYCYQENNNDDEEKKYIDKVVKGAKNNLEAIDKIILDSLKNWSMQRISKIDLAILRLAIYELNYLEDVPEKVTANEAVELAKMYGNQDSKSFVNGVIAKLIKDKKEE